MKYFSHNKVLITLILFLIVLNIFGYRLVKGYVELIARNRIELATEDIGARIRSRINNYSQVLRGSAALFSASEKVTKEEWEKYVESVDIENNFPGIQVLGYSPYVTSENLSNFENRLTMLGVNDYKIFPNLSTEYSAPILFIYPPSEDINKVIGFNMATDATRKKALDSAIDLGKLSASDRLVPLVDKIKNIEGVGIAMYYPVYWNNTDVSTVEARRQNIKGFIVAGVRPNEMMINLTLKAAPGINFQVFDNSTNGDLNNRSIIFNSGSGELLEPGFVPRYSNKDIVTFPNTNWYIRFVAVPDNQLFDLFNYALYFIFVLNSILSILLFLFVKKLLLLYRKADRESLDYAEKLIYEDAIIDSDDEGIIMTNQLGIISVFNKKAEQVLGYSEVEVQKKMDFLSFIPRSELSAKVLELQKRTGIAIKHDFDAIITDCLLDGKEHCQWGLINKDGQPRRTDMVVRPVYDKDNHLLGYKFTF